MKAPRGFTLLEVLVAFSIMGLSLTVLLQAFSGGLRNGVLAQEYTIATLHAESILATIGVEEPLTEGAMQGVIDDKYSWQANVVEFIDENDDNTADFQSVAAFTPYVVQLTVSWPGSRDQQRSVVLETLRLVAAD